MLFRSAAQPAQTCWTEAETGSARAVIRGDRLRRVAGLPRRAPTVDGSSYDPLIKVAELGEDDYYRFRHQPPAKTADDRRSP